LFQVKNIRFQLLDTSREPGVCMNWPLNAKDKITICDWLR